MGNSLLFREYEEQPGPANIDFFKRLQLKWVQVFFSKVRATGVSAFHLDGEAQRFSWRDFFRIFTEIKDEMEHGEDMHHRSIWHPATMGFIMRPGLLPDWEDLSAPKPLSTIPDDFTDDDASDSEIDDEAEEEGRGADDDDNDDDDQGIDEEKGSGKDGKSGKSGKSDVAGSEQDSPSDKGKPGVTSNAKPARAARRKSWVSEGIEEQGEGISSSERTSSTTASNRRGKAEAPKERQRKPWDPATRSPIYFGYHDTTVAMRASEKKEERDKNISAEQRAVDRARQTRSSLLDNVQKSCESQAAMRLKLIDEIDKKYAAASARREKDLNEKKKDLPEGGFKTFKRQWDSEYDAAEAAYEAEVGQLRYTHHVKTTADNSNLSRRREEMEAFKDAESQEVPAAERLEEIARVEISRWIDELHVFGEALEKARLEYLEMREELEYLQSKGVNKKNEKQLRELKSVVNHAESLVREKQHELENGLLCLSDAEALLKRAIRIKEQQDELLPLFSLLAKQALPSSCRMDHLACSFSILMDGSFEQKCNFIFNLYDIEGEGLFSSSTMKSVLMLFHETLYLLRYIPYGPIVEEVQNCVWRAFVDLGLKPGVGANADYLTLYEVQQTILSLVGHSNMLADVMGFNYHVHAAGARKSTFQRNRMSAIGLLTRGMLPPTIAKYRVHYEITKYWPQLNPRIKASIHERAMSMGEGDPLRPDYTRFMAQTVKKRLATIPPLEHGHLGVISFIEGRARNAAASKIQALLRAYSDRKVADLRAKRQAFLDAKEMAFKEMKAKVVKEFKKREATTGAIKMKWESQVRLKQGKLRADGQNLGRADVVMVMMEEAISKAKVDIEARFIKLEEKEDFSKVQLHFRSNEFLHDPSKHQDIKSMFDIVSTISVNQDSLRDVHTPRDGPSAYALSKAYAQEEKNDEEEEGGEKQPVTATCQSQALGSFARERAQLTIQGNFRHDPKLRGESLMEADLRVAMMWSEPPEYRHFFSRLRALDSALTAFKVWGILAELPSKRLLIRYVGSMDKGELAKELRVHFRFTRNHVAISNILKQLVSTDFDSGLLFSEVSRLQQILEPGMRQTVSRQLVTAVDTIETFLERKLATNETVTEEGLIALDIERADKYVRKFRAEIGGILNEIERFKSQFRRAQLSVFEVEKKQRIAYLLRDRRAGNRNGEYDPILTMEDRQNWVYRLKTADRLVEETHHQKMTKYAELRTVCREFLETATADAMLIIAEHHQPKYRKTLPVSLERDVNGRARESGRGMEGKCFTYEAHNISYTVVEDYDGVYNGSDEFAAKAGGRNRLGALEYFKTHTPKLNIPQLATIDYGGYRVVATAKIPTENVSFNDEGEVRKVTEDQVHGTIKDGDIFLNKDKMAQSALRTASLRLNLAEHSCRGLKDILPLVTAASADIQVFQSKVDGEFYCRNFSRAFPPEHPECTSHLRRAPRDHSIFWRHLRPEFCRKYEAEQLSPDALCLIVQRAPDRAQQNLAVEKATIYLVKELIPKFLSELTLRKYSMPTSEGLGLDITAELHCRGINIRHVGLMRSLLWRQLPGEFDIYFGEKKVHTTADMRAEMMGGESLRLSEIDAVLKIAEMTEKGDQITSNSIPISALFMERSKKGLSGRCGVTPNESNNEDLRIVLLAEMVARTVKNLIRLELRNYAKKTQTISAQFIAGTILEFLNVVTGAHPQANYYLQNLIYEGIRERFGPHAIRPSEKINMQEHLRPATVYVVKRMQMMMGIQISAHCLAEFFERPALFTFCELDLLEVAPKVRHSFPIMAFADAMLVTLKAQEAMRLVYSNEVMEDHPALYLRMFERKGARTAENKGLLGSDFDALYTSGCDLWLPGPIASDPFSRSVAFSKENKSYIDCKFHDKVVPQAFYEHFSIEIFICCTGGADTVRYVLMSGRYGLVVSKDGHLTFVFIDGLNEVNVKFSAVEMDKWSHVLCTWDGNFLRCYMNGEQVVATEIEGPMRRKSSVFESEIAEQLADLDKEEETEIDVVAYNTEKQADTYFMSKPGTSFLKNETQNIMESEEFQALNIGANERNEQKAIQLKRSAALVKAKNKYLAELSSKNLNDIKQKFRLKKDELNDMVEKKREEGRLRVRTPLRIGASPPSAASRVPTNLFVGKLSCFSIYNTSLSVDRVRAHYQTAQTDRTKDAQRLFSMAAMKYEEALSLAPDDLSILSGFALSLTEYLKIEINSTSSQGVSKGKLKVLEAIDRFKAIGVPEGAAAILKAIPHDSEYALLVCRAFTAVKSLDKYFFSRGINMSRADLVHIPQIFGLDNPGNPQELIDAAAAIYSEVCRDHALAFSYGETDVSWVSELTSSELVIALLRHAREDKSLKLVQVGELFKSVGRDKISITDEDVSVSA